MMDELLSAIIHRDVVVEVWQCGCTTKLESQLGCRVFDAMPEQKPVSWCGVVAVGFVVRQYVW